MNNYFKVVVLHIVILYLLGVFNGTLQQTIKKLDLYEGELFLFVLYIHANLIIF